MHGAGDVHHGRLPVLRRAGRAARVLCPATGRRTRPTDASPATAGLPICRSAPASPTTCRSRPGRCLQAETGPQGGHHVWIATRMKNLKQAGSITKISGLQPGTNTPIPPTTLAFTYGPDEGGYCKLYGIRYQLDNEGIDYKQFLGKPLDITVIVTDAAGSKATATMHVQIAPTLLNP